MTWFIGFSLPNDVLTRSQLGTLLYTSKKPSTLWRHFAIMYHRAGKSVATRSRFREMSLQPKNTHLMIDCILTGWQICFSFCLSSDLHMQKSATTHGTHIFNILHWVLTVYSLQSGIWLAEHYEFGKFTLKIGITFFPAEKKTLRMLMKHSNCIYSNIRTI